MISETSCTRFSGRRPPGLHELDIVHHDQVQAPLAAQQAPGARAKLGDADRRRVVDEELQVLQLLARLKYRVELGLADAPAPDLVGGHLRPLGEDAQRQLLGRHLQREKRDRIAVDLQHLVEVIPLAHAGPRGVEGDIGCQRRLAHAGPASQHEQVGALETAQPRVDVLEPGRHARQAAFASEGAFGHVDGGGERAGEGPEARVLGAGRGKLEQPVLRLFDPAGGGQFEVAVIGLVDDLAADGDERAAQMQVVDGLAEGDRVDDADGARGQLGQVTRPADIGQPVLLLEMVPQRRGARLAAAFGHALDGLVDAPVARVEEMVRLQEIADLLQDAVVHQDRAEQRHLDLQIGRKLAIGGAVVGRGLEGRLFGEPGIGLCCHGSAIRPG